MEHTLGLEEPPRVPRENSASASGEQALTSYMKGRREGSREPAKPSHSQVTRVFLLLRFNSNEDET